jgi:hypothetical protein
MEGMLIWSADGMAAASTGLAWVALVSQGWMRSVLHHQIKQGIN